MTAAATTSVAASDAVASSTTVWIEASTTVFVDSSPPATASAPATAEWFVIDADGFASSAVESVACCGAYPSPPGQRLVGAWTGDSGVRDGLLLVQRIPVAQNEQWAFPQRYFRPQADGSSWMFDSFGLAPERMIALADSVALADAADAFILPDPSMHLIGEGTLGDGELHTQAYESELGRATLSVGDYRGQLEPFAEASDVRRTTIAGFAGWVATFSGGNLTVAWPVAAGDWATIDLPAALAPQVDEIIASVTASDIGSEFPTAVAHPEIPDQHRGIVSVIETPDHGPMIAFAFLDSLPPQGGDIPLSGWDWSAVAGEEVHNGTTWGGPWEVVGTWDGSTFTLTQPPRPAAPTPAHALGAPTPGCDETVFLPLRRRLDPIGTAIAGWFQTQSNLFDGNCGIDVSALVPSAELDEALAADMNDIVTVHYVFTPVTEPPPEG